MSDVLNMPVNLDPDLIMEKALDVAASKIEQSPKVSEILLRQFLRIDPENPKALSLMGLTMYRLGHCQESLEFFRRSLTYAEDPETYNNMALAYASIESYGKSVECLEKALSIKPNQYLFVNNLALQYKQLGAYKLSELCFKRALDIESAPMVWCNLGGLYIDMKNTDKAFDCYKKAIEIEPELAAPHVFISYIYGFCQDWEKAFTEYEWRFDHFDQLKYYKKVYDVEKRWTGQNLDGKTVILYGEQGWGDQIQYVRYAEKVKDLGANVVVHCSKPLKTLFDVIPFVDETICHDIMNMERVVLPDYDYHCSLLSLPFLLKDFQPIGKPYIKTSYFVNIKNVEEYKNKLAVGIVWAGSPSHPNDQCRSMCLKEFDILQLDGVRLFNLQVGSSRRFYTATNKTVDFSIGGEKIRLVDMTPHMTDYEQSARILGGLDLIISVDTSVVHLAGAMGVPCWVLLPYNSDWRWGISGETTVWYDSLRLFRQESPNDWSGLMEIVKRELEIKLECQF
jgi:tetratricopeptide (TPR) repeat protein